MDIGVKIKHKLIEKGMTQRDLAKEVGIGEGTISYYILGKRMPKASVLEKIAQSLGVPVDYFYATPSKLILVTSSSGQRLAIVKEKINAIEEDNDGEVIVWAESESFFVKMDYEEFLEAFK